MDARGHEILQSISRRYHDLLKVGVVPLTMSFREFIVEDLKIDNIPEEVNVEREYLQQTEEFTDLCK